MDFDPQQKSFNFFRKELQVDTANSWIKAWGMMLYIFFHSFKKIKFNQFLIVLGFICASFLALSYLETTEARNNADLKKREANLVEYQRGEQNKQNEEIKKALEQANLTKSKIEAVSKITAQDFEAIKTHLLKSQNDQITSLNEIYWTYLYVSNNDYKYTMSKINNDIDAALVDVKFFYSSRLHDITQAYNAIHSNNVAVIVPTHDNQDALDKILYWQIAAKINEKSTRDSVQKLIISSREHLTDPVKLNDFLNLHKEDIQNKKLFN